MVCIGFHLYIQCISILACIVYILYSPIVVCPFYVYTKDAFQYGLGDSCNKIAYKKFIVV